jgi:hypothetical protein
MRERKGASMLLVGKPDGKRPPERPRLNWEILNWYLKKQNARTWSGLIGIRIG